MTSLRRQAERQEVARQRLHVRGYRETKAKPTKDTPWSPLSPDPAGGWWLYGIHYNTRGEAETALEALR